MILYKNVLDELRDSGYTTTRLRRDNLLSESVLTRIRNNQSISIDTLDVICRLTGLQPGDLLEYQDDDLEFFSEK